MENVIKAKEFCIIEKFNVGDLEVEINVSIKAGFKLKDSMVVQNIRKDGETPLYKYIQVMVRL